MEPFGQHIVAFCALVGDERFDRRRQGRTVARRACLNERNKKITSRHES